VGVSHPFNWLDISGSESLGVMQSAMMRGQPAAFDHFQAKQIPGRPTTPWPVPAWLHSRPYDRGAGAYSPKFGTLNINPIGAGVYAPYRLPTIAGPGARYEWGAIWFDVQTTPTTVRMSPTMPVDSVNALLASSYVGASYLTTG
jgi:hypothetical protein